METIMQTGHACMEIAARWAETVPPLRLPRAVAEQLASCYDAHMQMDIDTLKAMRTLAGLSQESAAAMADVSVSTIKRAEQQPDANPKAVRKLVEALAQRGVTATEAGGVVIIVRIGKEK